MFDQLKEIIFTLIWPEKSSIPPAVFLGFYVCIMFYCVGFLLGMMSFPESILAIILVIGSSVIGLGTFMTRFSYHYLKSISLRGFGFLVFAVLSFYIVQSESFPTDNPSMNWLLMVICIVFAILFIFYASLDLMFAVYFSMTRKSTVYWNKVEGKLHVNSRHVYFCSNTGEKRFAINSNDIVDVETSDGKSESSYFKIYFLNNGKICSEQFRTLNSKRMCKNIKKLFGI